MKDGKREECEAGDIFIVSFFLFTWHVRLWAIYLVMVQCYGGKVIYPSFCTLINKKMLFYDRVK